MNYIFIGGCGRSGTTMLADILGASDNAFTVPETHFLHDLARLDSYMPYSPTYVVQFLRREWHFKSWEITHSDSEISELVDDYSLKQTFLNIFRKYTQVYNIPIEKQGYMVEHSPLNLEFYHGWHRLFPEAQYIHIIRDGRAVYSSMKKQKWASNNPLTITKKWSERVTQGILLEQLIPDKCKRVFYEDIIHNPEESIKKLCEFTGLSYHPKIINGGGLRKPLYTIQTHPMVGSVPNSSALSKWRENLSKFEIKAFLSHFPTWSLMKSLGYLGSDCQYSGRIGICKTLLLKQIDLIHGLSRLYYSKMRYRRVMGNNQKADGNS